MSKKMTAVITAVIVAVGTIVASIITSNSGSTAHTDKLQDAEKSKVGIVNRNIININGTAITGSVINGENNKREKNELPDNQGKNKNNFVQPYKRPEDTALILQRKECVTSNGSGNIDFSNGLFFKFYSFEGSEGRYTLKIGNSESGRLYLNLGYPPVTVDFEKNKYNLWVTKPSNGLFHVCIKRQPK